MREDVIRAAREVASVPNDHNLTVLINAIMAWPFSDMPKEYLNQPIPPRTLITSNTVEYNSLIVHEGWLGG